MSTELNIEERAKRTVADYLCGLKENDPGTPLGCVEHMSSFLAQQGVFLTQKQRDGLVMIVNVEMYAMIRHIEGLATAPRNDTEPRR